MNVQTTLELPITVERKTHPPLCSSDLLDPVILFVQSDSHYKSLGLDCYDEARDARTYTGNAPVVCHPPCQRWGNMGIANWVKYGGSANNSANRFCANCHRHR